jgi:hypothetical protein
LTTRKQLKAQVGWGDAGMAVEPETGRTSEAFGALAEGPGTPLHPWIGLFQWVMVALWETCTIVLALRLLRVTRVTGALS